MCHAPGGSDIESGAAPRWTVCVATFCSSAIRRIRRGLRLHSALQSLSRGSRRRAVLSCAKLSIWHDFTIPRTVLMFRSRPHSKAFHRPGIFRDRGSTNASHRADVVSQSKEPTTSGWSDEHWVALEYSTKAAIAVPFREHEK
jgi:hypothetical protein